MKPEDFGFGGESGASETTPPMEEKTNLETGEVGIDGTTNLDAGETGGEGKAAEKNGGEKGSSSTGGQEESSLTAGDSVEIDGVNYTVNEDGALVDEKVKSLKLKKNLQSCSKKMVLKKLKTTIQLTLMTFRNL